MLKETNCPALQQDTALDTLSRLGAAALKISEHRESRPVAQEIAHQARFLTEARYGALLCFDEHGNTSDFVISGMAPEQANLITSSPWGRGVLSKLHDADKPLRIGNIGDHPDSVGVPPHHPVMASFLGTPIRYRGRHLANLYLADKQTHAEFTLADEELVTMFALQAAAAMFTAGEYDQVVSSKAELETLLDSSPMGVFVLDAQTGRLKSQNREAQRIAIFTGLEGLHPEEAVKALSIRRLDGSEVSMEEGLVAPVVCNGETVRAQELLVNFPNGRTLHLLVNAAPIYSDEGDVVSVAFATQDLAPLEDIDRERRDYLSLVGKELRSPLSTIKGSVSALAEALTHSSSSESHQLLKIIDLQADLMRAQLNGVSDLIDIEAGTLAINPEPNPVATLLQAVCTEFQRLHGGRDILVDIEADLPSVMIDRQKLGHSINTLLLCVLRCSSPTSSLMVSARRKAGQVAVTISTEGLVAPDHELYETIREVSRNQVKGGFESKSNEDIALAVCKGVLNSHGGKLWVESGESGQGMTVGFTMPVEAETISQVVVPSSPAPVKPYPVEGGKARILSVVENPRMLSAIQRTLSHCGYVPIGTLNYADLDRLITDEKPHLVLLDLTAPNARDFDVIQKVTRDYGVPAIVLSGQGDDECIVRTFEKGADDYIVKPFSPSELVARIKASFRKRSDSRNALAREEFVVGDLSISYPERRVAVAGKKVHLTATEYQLLYELSTRAGRVLTQDELLRRIWGEEYMGDIQLLRAFVKTLRQKLGDNARRPTYIFTEHGVGYRMPKP